MGLFSSSKELVGLDIGSSSIKIVELKKGKGGHFMTSFGMAPIAEDAIVDGEIINHISVADTIKDLCKQLKLKNKNVCVSVAGSSVIIKKINMAQVKEKDLKDQIFWEVEQYIPFSLNEINVDYQVVKETSEGLEVILVAVKKDFMDMYFSVVRDAGLNVKIVDIDSFAIQNLFEYSYQIQPEESVALVDIGSSLLNINVVSNGVPVFTRDVTLGGKSLTKEIQKRLGISFQEAEALKIDGTDESQMPQEIVDLVQMISENMAAEIRKSLDFYIASSSDNIISYILISGGSSMIPGIDKVLEEHIGVPVQHFNPFNVIGYDQEIFNEDYISTIASLAVLPVGLAFRGMEA